MSVKISNKIKNSAWILSEKIISIFGLIFVTSFVAKYVGAANFGLISISLLTFQFVQTVSCAGSDMLILKRVSQNEISGRKLIFSYLLLVPFLYLIISSSVFCYILFFTSYGCSVIIFFIASCIACFFSSIDLFSFYNEAKLNAKFNAISNVVGLLASLLVRFVIAHFKLDFRYLVVPIILVTLIPFLLRNLRFFFIEKNKFTFGSARNTTRYLKYCVSAGVGILFSVIAVAIYTRINQAFIAYFLGMRDSGIYSVAMTLSGAWVFIPNAIIMSFFPFFFSEKDFNLSILKIKKILLLVVVISLIVILFVFLLSPFFIDRFYGFQFHDSLPIIYILSFASMFAILSGVLDRFTVKYGGSKYLIYKSLAVLSFCLFGALLLIPNFGIQGAAYNVLLTELFSCTIANYFFKGGVHVKIQCSFLNPKDIKRIASGIRKF